MTDFYAWVKLVADSAPKPAMGPDVAGTPPADCKLCGSGRKILSGHRPPHLVAARADSVSGNWPKFVEACADKSSGQRLLRVPPKESGEWDVDDVFAGEGTQSFELAHFIGDRKEAVLWLDEADGLRWRSNALNLALIRFAFPGEPMGPACPSLPTPPSPDPMHHFQHDSWRFDYARLAHAKSDYVDDKDLTALDPGEYSKEPDRCDKVRALQQEFGSERDTEIREQSSDFKAMGFVVSGGTPLRDKPKTRELIRRLGRGLRFPIFKLKAKYARARPSAACGGIVVRIDPREPLFPAHPAYPAGHATLVYTLLELFGAAGATPAHLAAMKGRADRVTQNRVIAGLHYPDDNEAGNRLANKLLKLLLTKQGAELDKLRTLVKGAVAEWP